MLTAYSRVTVVTAQRNIDLALPNALPLADVLPQVMRYVDTDEAEAGSPPARWTLARLGGASFSLGQTLSESGVLDGDILELRSQTTDAVPTNIEDVRDAVEDRVDAAGGAWSTRTTGSFTILTGSAALVILGLVLGPRDAIEPVPAFLVAFAVLGASWWASVFARTLDAQFAAIVAMGWAGLAAASIDSTHLSWGWLPLLMALGAALIAAVLSRLLTVATTAHIAFAAIMLFASLGELLAAVTSIPAAQERRVIPVLAILAVGVLPRVSLSVGGLSSADYRVRHVGQLSTQALRARYRDSNAILIGCLISVSAIVVLAAGWLDTTGSAWDRTLAVSIGVAAIMRSRLFSRTLHMLGLRLAGLAALAAVGLRWAAENTDVLIWTPVMIGAIVAAGASLASMPLSTITRARIKRVLNIAEFLVIVDLLVVLGGAMGLYEQVGGVF